MADHVIVQVRDALITRLKAQVSAVSNRVFRMDEEPTDLDQCPYLMVQLGADNDERMGVNGSASDPSILEDINQTIFIHCVVKAAGDMEAAAYNLRRDVETALLATAAGLNLDGKVAMTTRVGAQPEQDSEGELEAYAVALQFEFKIRHLEGSPDSFVY